MKRKEVVIYCWYRTARSEQICVMCREATKLSEKPVGFVSLISLLFFFLSFLLLLLFYCSFFFVYMFP